MGPRLDTVIGTEWGQGPNLRDRDSGMELLIHSRNTDSSLMEEIEKRSSGDMVESQLLNLSPVVARDEVQALGDQVAMNPVSKGTTDHPREQTGREQKIKSYEPVENSSLVVLKESIISTDNRVIWLIDHTVHKDEINW